MHHALCDIELAHDLEKELLSFDFVGDQPDAKTCTNETGDPNAPLSHLVDTAEANALLTERGHGDLRLVDNGAISRGETALDLDDRPHAYHLIPSAASKAGAAVRSRVSTSTSGSSAATWKAP